MLFLLVALQTAPAPVVYHAAFPNAAHHEAEITITFSGIPAGPLELRMSRSSPGRYALHEFGKNVYNVTAADGRGRALGIVRPNPYQWDVPGHDGTVTVRYTLFADRADGTYSGIDLTHAHLNIPATFMFARGLRARPIRVTFEPPANSGWKVASQLASTGDPFAFTAPNLDYFMDSPTELSAFSSREWTVASGARTATLRLSVYHDGTEAEVDRYLAQAQAVVREQQAVFGELPAFDYGTYTFIADYLPWVAGDGMEHRNSTILASTGNLRADMAGLVGTVSHEFFHAWNMERLRSAALEPFDFEQANMTDELWFGEGFTSYFDDLTMHRAGLLEEAAYFRGLAGTLNGVINAPGRRFRSVVEMSRHAPFVDRAVSVDPTNHANTFVSYYTWGAALALGLDLTLRTEYPGKSLDGYMRLAWERHGRPERAYTLTDLETLLTDYTGDAAFAATFFRDYVRGREVVDYAALLTAAGLELVRARPGQATLGNPQLGDSHEGVLVRSQTLVGTPLYEAGIDEGDRITGVNGRAVTRVVELEEAVRSLIPGDSVTMSYVQRGLRRTGRAVATEDPEFVIRTFEEQGKPVSSRVVAFRQGWLGGRAR